MANFVNVVRFNATSSGTGDFVVSSAVQGYQTPAAASAGNGLVYSYRAESSDLSQWEIGTGAYAPGSTTLARTTVIANSSGTTSKINFSAAPQVALLALAGDLVTVTRVAQQVFTSSGTYTPTSGTLYAIVECVGGGGSGGSVQGSASNNLGGGGGASGGYSRVRLTAAQIGASQTVTIGAGGTAPSAGANNGNAGGDTSLGTLCVARGGGGGLAGTTGQVGQGGAPSASAGTGDVTAAGNPGHPGVFSNNISITIPGGTGGSSFFGGGARGSYSGGAANGNAAGSYGSGGGGAYAAFTASNVAGAAGSAGLIVITEFCA